MTHRGHGEISSWIAAWGCARPLKAALGGELAFRLAVSRYRGRGKDLRRHLSIRSRRRKEPKASAEDTGIPRRRHPEELPIDPLENTIRRLGLRPECARARSRCAPALGIIGSRRCEERVSEGAPGGHAASAKASIVPAIAARARAMPFSAVSGLTLRPSIWMKLISVRPRKPRTPRRYGSWKSSDRAGLTAQTVRDWVMRFNVDGPDGLINF
jgi:hypothetical protein